jgi:hypothetical protein
VDQRYDWGDYNGIDRRVTTFVYGGLLFSQFAGQAQIPHFLHDKRARLDLAVALEAPSAAYEHEEELNEQLTSILRTQLKDGDAWVDGLDALPSVLPYLLSRFDPQSPTELVLRALELRDTGMMAEYRSWKSAAVKEFGRTLAIPLDVERSVRSAAAAVTKFVDTPAGTDFEFKLRFAAIPDVWVNRLWSWASASLPGRQHVKALYRLQLAQREKSHVNLVAAIDRHVEDLWRRSTEPIEVPEFEI